VSLRPFNSAPEALSLAHIVQSYWVTEPEVDDCDAFSVAVRVGFSAAELVTAVITMKAGSDTTLDFSKNIIGACKALWHFQDLSSGTKPWFPASNISGTEQAASYSSQVVQVFTPTTLFNCDHWTSFTHTQTRVANNVAQLFDVDAISSALKVWTLSQIERRPESTAIKFQAALHRVRSTLTADENALAAAAVDEAMQTLRHIDTLEPWVGVNAEGAALVQWRGETSGVLLVFTGDGTFTASVKRDAKARYVDDAEEYSVAVEFPKAILGAIFDVR